MKERILEILEELIQLRSFTNSAAEKEAAVPISDWFRQLPYFKEHPHLTGQFPIPGDMFDRSVIYALVLGKSARTFVTMGHFDVVGIEEYGALKESAFNHDALIAGLPEKDIPREAREDLESGEWLFGRGAADMKGGLAVHMALLEEYASQRDRDGAMLFIGVPDEESYSAGMRAASSLMVQLKEAHELEYQLLVDPEPNIKSGGKQVISTGSVGKCLPVVLVQGVKAHVGRCFEGLNPLSILSEIFRRTEMSLDFVDTYLDEATLPPVWTHLRDRKFEYDVSLPYKAGGFFTVLSLETTPDQVLDKLAKIASAACQDVILRLDETYQQYKKMSRFTIIDSIDYKPLVLTFSQLTARLKKERGVGFDSFYEEASRSVQEKVAAGILNYPEATMELMDQVLSWAEIQEPLVLLGFAPPYYPAVNSSSLREDRDMAQEAFLFISEEGKKHSLKVAREYYFTGISDLSYCGIDQPFDYEAFSRNTPLWGPMYQIDFDSISKASVPAIIFGPWGKDLHKMTERVHRESLTVITPAITRALRDFCWREE